MELLGGLAHSELYTSASCRCYYKAVWWWMESVCWKRRIPAGQFLQARLKRELFHVPNWGFGRREMTGCGWALRRRSAPGPRSLWAWLGSSPFLCSLLKGNYVTAGTRQLSFVNIFSLSCHVRERHTQTLPKNSTFRNYRHKPIEF